VTLLASSLINWSSLWKICVAALIGGAGVVIVFGFLLFGLKMVNASTTGAGRFWGYALSIVCGVAVLAAVVIGIYAMVNKPSSKKPAKPKTALVVPARSGVRLIARAP
jgi:cytochrome b561